MIKAAEIFMPDHSATTRIAVIHMADGSEYPCPAVGTPFHFVRTGRQQHLVVGKRLVGLVAPEFHRTLRDMPKARRAAKTRLATMLEGT